MFRLDPRGRDCLQRFNGTPVILILGGEVRARAGNEVEDGELLLVESFCESPRLFLRQRLAERNQLVEVGLYVHAASVVTR